MDAWVDCPWIWAQRCVLVQCVIPIRFLRAGMKITMLTTERRVSLTTGNGPIKAVCNVNGRKRREVRILALFDLAGSDISASRCVVPELGPGINDFVVVVGGTLKS